MAPAWRKIEGFVRRNRRAIGIAAALGMATLGFYALHRILLEVHLHDLRAAFHALQPWQIATALALTIASYGLLTLYDVLALNIIGKPLPYRTAALASFTSYTLSHNLGLALLTGGSVRYRIYSAAGLDAGDIVGVIATVSVTFWYGVIVMTAAALALHPAGLALGPVVVPELALRLAGTTIILTAAILLVLSRKPGRRVRLLGWPLPLPTAPQAMVQIGLAACDLALASAALLVLIPGASIHIVPLFFLGYVLAIIVALVSHVPGGVGVFEAVMLSTLPAVDRPGLFAALIAYRAIYYLLPLLAATVLLAVHERNTWRHPLASTLDTTHAVIAGVAPMLLAALSFVGGAILLVSGSLPALPDRLDVLRGLVPLPFVEASHIFASLAGTGLLLLAPGLYRRLDGAFILTRALLIAGAVFSLAKGLDFEEAAVLLIIAGLLQWTRPAFYRRTALTTQSLSAGWIVAIAIAIGLSLWIGLFAFKHVDYQNDLWWKFAWKGNASRFLRGSFAAAIVAIGAILIRLFGGADPAAASGALEEAPEDACFAECERTDAMLALTGDKRFLTSATGNAFLMYQVQGRSWVVMGDPVGRRAEWPDLLWRIREFADAAQGRLLLYQISANALPIAIDLGLQLVKYGEEARVDLARFTLDGAGAKPLRYAERRAIRDGAVFEVVPAMGVAALMPELRAVSDDWLKAKGSSEKSFSVGRFDPSYLARFDCAVIRHEGRIVAFANIWATPNHRELSIDLMRHASVMPYGTMDFLILRLMHWAKAENYRWFTLGLAPLSGIQARRLAPMWARAGALLYRHGEAFYGFEGLRAYKDKFSPTWESRYIAGPHGLGMARALVDLQALIGGGRASAARQRTAVGRVTPHFDKRSRGLTQQTAFECTGCAPSDISKF